MISLDATNPFSEFKKPFPSLSKSKELNPTVNVPPISANVPPISASNVDEIASLKEQIQSLTLLNSKLNQEKHSLLCDKTNLLEVNNNLLNENKKLLNKNKISQESITTLKQVCNFTTNEYMKSLSERKYIEEQYQILLNKYTDISLHTSEVDYLKKLFHEASNQINLVKYKSDPMIPESSDHYQKFKLILDNIKNYLDQIEKNPKL